jgi:4'-phosphopantetheinyl transferase EntD
LGIVETSSLLGSLFESTVVARVHRGATAADVLHPEEAARVSRAVEGRRAAFTGGRLAAHSALEALGIPEGPLLADGRGAPLWPEGVVGSITHTTGFCGAVVALRSAWRGIGIDAEIRSRVGERLWRRVLTPLELERLHSLPERERAEAATTAFSAKEAFYKCQYQITGEWLGFKDVEVQLHESSFFVRVLRSPGVLTVGMRFEGRHAFLPSLVLTGIAIRSSDPVSTASYPSTP